MKVHFLRLRGKPSGGLRRGRSAFLLPSSLLGLLRSPIFCRVSPVIHPFFPLRSLVSGFLKMFCGFSLHFFWPTWFLLILSIFFLSSVIFRSVKQWRFWQCPSISAGRTNQAKIFNRLQHRWRWLFSKRHLCQKIFLLLLILCHTRRGWTPVCKDSREQFHLITIEESRLAADRVTQSFDHE